MDAAHIAELCQSYNIQAKKIVDDIKEARQRRVSLQIYYHLPDTPHLVQEFNHQIDDAFIAGDEVERKLSHMGRAFMSVQFLGANVVKDTIAFYRENLEQASRHLDKVLKTADEFEIPFRQFPAEQHPAFIAGIPFKGTQQFLHSGMGQ